MRYVFLSIIFFATIALTSCKFNKSTTGNDEVDSKLAEIIDEYPYLSSDYTATPVDLGLSVKWASHNLGAITDGDTGYLFRFGSTIPSPSEDTSPYDFNTKSDYSIAGESEYDPATKYWGPEWRMPTLEQFEELIHNCEWTYVEHTGYFITGPNGATIFLPVSFNWYWTATTKKNKTPLCYLIKGYGIIHLDNYNSPKNPQQIRPVYIE